jgi:membrane protein DedA with SNARE-associated domain
VIDLLLASGMQMDPQVLEAVERWGPFAVFLLLIMPLGGEEIVTVPAGYLIGQGHLPFWATAAFAYVGAFLSDGAWYLIAYRWGTPLLHKKWFKRLAHPRRMLQAKHQIEKRGAWLIVTARFVPGTRTSVVTMSGLLHMPPWKFIIAEGACLLVTVPFQLGLGALIYHLSKHIVGTPEDLLSKIFAIMAIVALILISAFVFNWWYTHYRSKERAPRSKAAWLRRFRPRRALPLRKRTQEE